MERSIEGTNAWSIMSVDVQRGIIFLPLGSPSYDFYGADRKGRGLFGNSLVALNAGGGKLPLVLPDGPSRPVGL